MCNAWLDRTDCKLRRPHHFFLYFTCQQCSFGAVRTYRLHLLHSSATHNVGLRHTLHVASTLHQPKMYGECATFTSRSSFKGFEELNIPVFSIRIVCHHMAQVQNILSSYWVVVHHLLMNYKDFENETFSFTSFFVVIVVVQLNAGGVCLIFHTWTINDIVRLMCTRVHVKDFIWQICVSCESINSRYSEWYLLCWRRRMKNEPCCWVATEITHPQLGALLCCEGCLAMCSVHVGLNCNWYMFLKRW